MGSRFGERVADDGQGRHKHDGSDGLGTRVREMAIPEEMDHIPSTNPSHEW